MFSPQAKLGAVVTSRVSGVAPVTLRGIKTRPHVSIKWTNGTATITAGGSPAAFPDLTYYDHTTPTGLSANQTVTNGVLNVTANGNRTARVFGNAVIDKIMRLDEFSDTNTIKFFSTRLWRDTTTTPMTVSTGHERIFQYGASGVLNAQDGGWVFRINWNNTQGVARCLVPAMHFDYGKPGGASDDLIIQTSTIEMGAVNGAYDSTTGHYIMFAVQANASGAHHAIHLWVDDEAVITTTDASSPTLSPPGPSVDTPANGADSGGFTLFAQSVDDGTSILRDADVWPIWIGEAKDLTELETIRTRLKADIFATPYY